MKCHRASGWISFVITAALLLVAVGCHRKPAPSPKAMQQARLEWNLKTLVTAYEKNPDSGLAGEESVKAALTEFARMRANVFTADEPWQEIISTNCEAAVQAGCDDPIIRYLYLRFSNAGNRLDAVTHAAAMLKVAQKIQGSTYPAVRKFYAQFRAMQELNEAYQYHFTNMPPEAQAFISQNDVMTDINELLTDPTLPVEEAYAACHELLEKTYNHDFYQSTYQNFENVFATRWPDTALNWLFKGEGNYRLAWNARGGSYASEVSEDGWKGFHEHLALTEEALNRAWKIDPQDVRTATLMVKVCEGAQKGRDEMELWFARALQLAPNNYEACQAKLHYLYPQWYGSREDMIAFGRECVANEKWTGTVPLILSDAHWNYSRFLKDESDRTNYWKQPDVWPDIKASFDRFFEINPDAVSWRHNYAWYAFQCGQWKAFNSQLRQFGGYTNYAYFGGKAAFNQMVETARQQADQP